MKKSKNPVMKFLRLIAAYPRYRKTQRIFSEMDIRGDLETVRLLQNGHTSISRYGDGEFDWILGEGQEDGFQKNDPKMGARLKEVLMSATKSTDFVIGIPRQLTSVKDENFINRYFWVRAIKDRGMKWYRMFNSSATYWSSTFSRPYMGVKKSKNFQTFFNEAKKIFDNRNILIVEGAETYFSVGTDLLQNAKSIKRVICPAENAFSKYDDILKTTLELAKREDNPLILCALGPSATILAYDLSNQGFQGVDIGHLDMEYYWFVKGVTEPTNIPWKYMNELDTSDEERQMPPHYEAYKEQIAVTI